MGDTVDLMTTVGNHTFVLDDIRDTGGNPREDAPGSGFIVTIPAGELYAVLGENFPVERAMLIRNLPDSSTI